MGKNLGNKVAVITGGSTGIGLGAGKRLCCEGAQVFITCPDVLDINMEFSSRTENSRVLEKTRCPQFGL